VRERDLPFYVNGTLPDANVAALQREIASDAACADELREVRALRAALVSLDEAAPSASASLYAGVIERIGANDPAPRSSRSAPLRLLPGIKRWSLGLAIAACFAIVFVQIGKTIDRSGASNVASAPVALQERVAAVETLKAPAPAMAGAANDGASKAASADARSVSARQLARTGSIGLIVPDVATTLASITRLTRDQFGAITALQDDAPSIPGGKHTAEVTVSVPDDRFLSTLGQLAALGGVTTRSVTTEDLTDSIVDDAARLRNLRHEEADLLRIMDRSGKIDDVLAVEQQLAATRESIEQLDAEAKSMQHRVAYATISIDLSDEKAVPIAAPGTASQLGDAWHTALARVSGFTIGLIEQLFLVVAFLPYLAAGALVVYIVVRRTSGRS
jgi:anti-sigma factor RsiW